jgi:hypothetical protein
LRDAEAALVAVRGDMSVIDELRAYIVKYAERGACRCGRCVDAPADPAAAQPTGHTADVVFFEVSAREGANADALRALIAASRHGDFADVDPLDGAEHGYMELGGWLGDQGLALMFMGLCSVLGVCQLLTPKSVLGSLIDDDMAMQLAGSGMVTIRKAPVAVAAA